MSMPPEPETPPKAGLVAPAPFPHAVSAKTSTVAIPDSISLICLIFL